MKNINYILSFGGWFGLVVTLVFVIFFNKCGNTPQIIKEKTEIHNYYDSTTKVVPFKYSVQGKPIIIAVPANVDTAKILAMYFAKYPNLRVFQDSNIIATLIDTLSQNKFGNHSKFSYNWLKPIKTVESKTITVESPKKMQLLVGAHADFNKNYFKDFGPDVYVLTKRSQLIGVGYDIESTAFSFKLATSLNSIFKKK